MKDDAFSHSYVVLVPAFTRKKTRRWKFDRPLLDRRSRTSHLEKDPAVRIGPFKPLYSALQPYGLGHIEHRKGMMRRCRRTHQAAEAKYDQQSYGLPVHHGETPLVTTTILQNSIAKQNSHRTQLNQLSAARFDTGQYC